MADIVLKVIHWTLVVLVVLLIISVIKNVFTGGLLFEELVLGMLVVILVYSLYSTSYLKEQIRKKH